ncbi:hypothetical protein [Rubinisphaera margarita]|uniref:hypothetical protein n=1 Tax=Rubinisphaera margarita TaxID=2909586 RepID=UPI001EE7978C|nr:hypothetical protein [Rubinisphaera margarita]MCG6157399.1 hypothetical protein [Rubinisphaera margarita]
MTTKIHAVTGQSGRLILPAGQRGDAAQGEFLRSTFERGKVAMNVAHAAYDSDAIRQRGKQLRAKVCIKPNPTRKVKKR